MTFFDRFTAANVGDTPASLQLLFPRELELDATGLTLFLREYHASMEAATVDLLRVGEDPQLRSLVSADGPPAAVVGLVEWGEHVVKLVGFDAPMPYGPVEACVLPAMIPPEMKDEAKGHRSHVLLYYAGRHADALEQSVALAAVAGALARFDAITVLNEEARAAVPAFDLIPEGEHEDALHTLRELPLPYLFGGFLKMDVGDPERPWVRTFANHRFGLPNLAYHLASHAETGRIFQLLAGMLGYLRTMQESFTAGDTLDLGDGTKLTLREPTDAEWYLESKGTMLVVEPLAG